MKVEDLDPDDDIIRAGRTTHLYEFCPHVRKSSNSSSKKAKVEFDDREICEWCEAALRDASVTV